jgi:DNA-binding response OmpR family regulator
VEKEKRLMGNFVAGAYRVLVVDDDHFVLKMVSAALEAAGFYVSTAASGEDALDSIKRHGLPHLAIVDITMSFGMDGLEFCEIVHEFSDLPIVMLTAINEDKTIIDTIDRYAEDYITKPFNPGELVARVRRVLRRIGDFAYVLEALTRVDDYLGVNFPEKSALVDDKEVPLTPTETKLLYILMRNAGRTVTTEFIVRRLWPLEVVQEDRLRVYVHRLRRKIEAEPKRPTYILSQRGIGYLFSAPVDHKKVRV